MRKKAILAYVLLILMDILLAILITLGLMYIAKENEDITFMLGQLAAVLSWVIGTITGNILLNIK